MPFAFRIFGLFALIAVSPATALSARAETGAFSFPVIGDAPYAEKDRAMLAEATALIQAGSYPFVIHVGDYKGGGQRCTENHDADQQALIASLAPTPVFYTPGDNEWTDCDRFVDEATGVRYSDLDRLARVRALFFAEPVAAPEALAYRRQEAQPENATWTHGNVRFLTLHVVGTNNGRDWVTGDPLERAREAVAARDAANLAWLADGFEAAAKDRSAAVIIAMQADMTDVKDKPEDEMCTDVASSDDHPCDAFVALRRALADNARGFAGPVLLIHGDTAPFTLNQKIAGEEAKNLWRLNAAGDAGVGRTGFPYGVRDATLVTFDPSVDKPFSARGLVTGKQPKRR